MQPVTSSRLNVLLRIDSLEHQKRAAQVSSTLLSDSLVQAFGLVPAFSLRSNSERRANIGFSGRSHPDQQGSRANRGNDVRGAIGQENQAQIRTVLFHSTTQCSLGITGEVVGLVNYNDLEPLLRGLIHLLCLGDLLQQFLDHDSVVVTDIRGRNFEVVDGGDDVEFKLAVACRLEHSRVDLDLLDSRSVQFFQCRNDTCFLACSGRSID